MKGNSLHKSMRETFDKCIDISIKKNADYASDADPFKNFRMSEMVGVEPCKAIIIRITDKLSRISTLLDKEADVSDESIYDTIYDMINYLAILKAFKKLKE